MSDEAHPNCTEGHVCQVPSGKPCIEPGCKKPAGTLWGPLWCPDHDKVRLDRVSAGLHEALASFSRTTTEEAVSS